MTTLQHAATAHTPLYWGRIIGGAVLLEVLLFAVLIPLGLLFGMPGVPGATDFRVFFTAVPVACLAGGYLVTRWMLERIVSRRLLHGSLLGVLATMLYLMMCALQPGGIPAVVAAYGATLFALCQGLRIGGCVLGAGGGAVALPARGGTDRNS